MRFFVIFKRRWILALLHMDTQIQFKKESEIVERTLMLNGSSG